jgi:uncharacterized membrane protein
MSVMIRWALWILGGVLLGGVVHVVTVLALPGTATQDAYTRLSAVAPVKTVTLLPQPTPQKAILPFMDPAFATAVCPFDLTAGPIKLSLAVSEGYSAVSFYTRRDVPFYAINDRAAGRRVIELYLMTSDQHNAMPEEEDVTAADRLIVESPSDTGLILLRVLAPEPSLMASAERTVASGKCATLPAPSVAN